MKVQGAYSHITYHFSCYKTVRKKTGNEECDLVQIKFFKPTKLCEESAGKTLL